MIITKISDKEKRSPVLLAASRGGWRTVFILLRKGCDPTLKDINNRNLLHWIIINGGRCEDFAKEIKENSKCCLSEVLNEKDSTGCSPLVRKGRGSLNIGFEIIQFLISFSFFVAFSLSTMHHAKVNFSLL